MPIVAPDTPLPSAPNTGAASKVHRTRGEAAVGLESGEVPGKGGSGRGFTLEN